MKNFLRALRCAWPYRKRLAISITCAAFAALFWSLNFTAIYPVLKILGNEQSLQTWVDERIAATDKEVASLKEQVDNHNRALAKQKEQPANVERDKRVRDLTGALAKLEGKLESQRNQLHWYQIGHKWIHAVLPNDPFKTLVWVIGMVVVAVAIKGVFEFGQETLVGSVVNLSLFDLRNRFYRHTIHLDVDQFGPQGTHELMARFTNDMELLGSGLKTLFGRVVAEPLKAIGCIAIALWFSWQLTVMFVVIVPVALYLLTKVGRLVKRAARRLLERMSNIYKILQETFVGIKVVKAFTMEPYERRRFRSATREYYRKAMQVVYLDSLSGPVMEVLGVLAIAAALLVGAYLVLQHKTHILGMRMTEQPLEPETLIQLYCLLAAIADPVRKLSSVYTRLQSGAAAADRIFHFMDRVPRVRGNVAAPRVRHARSIEFRDVCFSYLPGKAILTNVHLDIKFGETIALVGTNGCGKSTLVGLMPRFYDADHGSILLDGVDIREVSLRGLRQQIGLVTQDTMLFDDSVHNNIAYGYRRANRDEVEAAARKAYAHEFITDLPQGYETRVGEGGCKLSGGQKQRLALARAILRDPAILILDEFTSQIDAPSEMLIQKALREFMKNRTSLVITHRLNTLEIADRIVVLDAGRVAAVGTHAQLMQDCAPYQRLYEAHFQKLCA